MIEKTVRKSIERKLGYRFKKRVYLETALTHPSYRHENEGILEDNQRLEFLGDAALGLAAAAALYRRFEEVDEGALTHKRSKLANRTTLARIGRELELGAHLRLGRGEEQSGGRERNSNLTDAVEAVIGAVFLDGGQKAVDRVFKRLWQTDLDAATAEEMDNPKGDLQEYCQKLWKISPAYRVDTQSGPAHAREYVCVASVKGRDYGTGRGMNKRTAEMEAARDTLTLLRAMDAGEADVRR